MIYHIFEFRSKVHVPVQTNTSYAPLRYLYPMSNIKNDRESMNSKHEFHIWFNELFEKYYIEDNDDGHGDWLKSDED